MIIHEIKLFLGFTLMFPDCMAMGRGFRQIEKSRDHEEGSSAVMSRTFPA
jgi:hypothetical protein